MKSNINKATIQRLLNQAKKDGIQKIVVRAIIRRDNKFLLLERAPSEFLGGLVVLPGGAVNTGEGLLHALAREVKEETNLAVAEITAYIEAFNCVSSSGKKTRQFNFFVKTVAGNIKLDLSEHSKYFLLDPSDKEFSELNISDGTKTVLLKVKKDKWYNEKMLEQNFWKKYFK